MVAKEKMENDKKKMETNWLCVQKWKTREYCHHKWKCGGVHDSREFGGDEMAAELQQQRLSNELDESGMLTYRQGTPCETFSLLKHLSIEINSEEISIFLQKCRKFKFHFTLRNEVLNNLPVNCFHSDRLYTLHQPCHPFHFPRLSFNWGKTNAQLFHFFSSKNKLWIWIFFQKKWENFDYNSWQYKKKK